ncbi:MAG: glutamate-1-semialdehyde 2,1-aminomutase [Deltaproteobacteria bacterium]|nr:glutamate-1-semialdehyde 2,1-aminomutase [Deltaproteobacteria bacterium]
MKIPVSRKLFSEAKKHIPGGVNSPVRAFSAVGGEPFFVAEGQGSVIQDVDGRRYIDYVGSWGTAVLGHAHPDVVTTICETASKGFSFGAPTEAETRLARVLCDAVPAMDMVRLVSSGTEACMSAVRLARGFTGKNKIIKFEGHYHGHADMLLVSAGSGAATFGNPSSAGVPEEIVRCTIPLPFNDLKALEHIFRQCQGEIAAVIAEPIAGNAGFIRPDPGFFQEVRSLCDKEGALMIIDEVMTGFRMTFGGVHQLMDLKPDLCTFGKIIGGGLPLAAFGGRREIMEQLSPSGPVYQAGTLSGNPLATACGLKTLEIIQKNPLFYSQLEEKSACLMEGIRNIAASHKIPVQTDYAGGMFGVYFSETPVRHFRDAQSSRTDLYGRYFNLMLKEGISLAPSAYEAGFVSAAHSQSDLDSTLAAAERSLKTIAEEGFR